MRQWLTAGLFLTHSYGLSAWIWGSSVKHNPQKVGIDHILEDEDVVQIVKRVG